MSDSQKKGVDEFVPAVWHDLLQESVVSALCKDRTAMMWNFEFTLGRNDKE